MDRYVLKAQLHSGFKKKYLWYLIGPNMSKYVVHKMPKNIIFNPFMGHFQTVRRLDPKVCAVSEQWLLVFKMVLTAPALYLTIQ